MNLRLLLTIGLVLVAAVCRVIPHASNFAPIGAIALFAGAIVTPRWVAFLVPFAGMAISDWILYATRENYPPDPTAYLSYALIVAIGFALRSRRTLLRVAIAAPASSSLFFLITNFGVWATGQGFQREKSLSGLLMCYGDGLPFYRNTFLSDVIFSAVLFGGFALMEHLVPSFVRRPAPVPVSDEIPIVRHREEVEQVQVG